MLEKFGQKTISRNSKYIVLFVTAFTDYLKKSNNAKLAFLFFLASSKFTIFPCNDVKSNHKLASLSMKIIIFNKQH